MNEKQVPKLQPFVLTNNIDITEIQKYIDEYVTRINNLLKQTLTAPLMFFDAETGEPIE